MSNITTQVIYILSTISPFMINHEKAGEMIKKSIGDVNEPINTINDKQRKQCDA